MSEELILSAKNQDIVDEFLLRPRKLKYDFYNGKLYRIIWSKDAHDQLLEKKKIEQKNKYRETYQKKEKEPKPISLYLRHKMGMPIQKKGRPKKQESEFQKTE